MDAVDPEMEEGHIARNVCGDASVVQPSPITSRTAQECSAHLCSFNFETQYAAPGLSEKIFSSLYDKEVRRPIAVIIFVVYKDMAIGIEVYEARKDVIEDRDDEWTRKEARSYDAVLEDDTHHCDPSSVNLMMMASSVDIRRALLP